MIISPERTDALNVERDARAAECRIVTGKYYGAGAATIVASIVFNIITDSAVPAVAAGFFRDMGPSWR